MDTVSPQQAAKLVTKIKQPSGMYAPSWRRMQKVLRSLCEHLPDPYPGIRRLSVRTHIPERTVARLLTQAESLGLLARVERPLPGRFDGYSYRLTFLDATVPNTVPVSAEYGSEKKELRSFVRTTCVQRSSAGRLGSPAARPRKINRYTGRCDVCAETVRAGEGFLHGHLPVHRECDDMSRSDWEREHARDMHGTTAYGEGDEAALPAQTTTAPKPQARLAKHFESLWNDEALGQHPEWRGEYRGVELGMAIGYIKRTFIDAGYSDEHVEAMIDAFFVDLLNPHCALDITPGQTAFQRFTGWWGHNLVPDPVIERHKAAEAARLLAAARTQSQASNERRTAAWARIEAAEAAGGTADREDLKIVGMPYVLPGRQSSKVS